MVKGIEDKEEKIAAITLHLAPILGQKLHRVETALLKMEDGNWDDWFDLPARLFFEQEKVVSVSWSYFDRLFIAGDYSLPFDLSDAEVGWKTNRIEGFSMFLGQTLQGVSFGQGDMTVEGKAVDIWTRLLLEFDKGWVEIYNGLDENAFAFHETKPPGIIEEVC